MHRTQGDGYVDEGGKRRFIDANPPTVIGTEDPAEWNNAVQEEVCNVIELNGGTVAASEAADRTAQWRQLYDMIFASAKIGNAAINEVSLSKLSDGTTNITSGSDTLVITAALLSLTNGSSIASLTPGQLQCDGAGAAYARMTSAGFRAADDDLELLGFYQKDAETLVEGSSPNDLSIVETARGTRYMGGSHPSHLKNTLYNKLILNLAAESFTWASTYSNGAWRDTTWTYLSNIPSSIPILSVNAMFKEDASGIDTTAGVSVKMANSGGFWSLAFLTIYSDSGSATQFPKNVQLYLEFDAQNLTP